MEEDITDHPIESCIPACFDEKEAIRVVPTPMGKRGRPFGTSNLHSKHPSSIAVRLKQAGIDWVVDLAQAIQANNETRINMWLKLLPYLVVTQGHRQPRKKKSRASKAALEALEELERE